MQSEIKQSSWLDVLKLEGRLLSLRATKDDLISLDVRHLLFGLVCTWVVGIGRYWDNPRVGLLQHLGMGSVVYIFVLSLFLWLIVWPLRPKNWSYFRVLTFITLVSPPAIIYAIPVESWNLETANSINSLFLLAVALWRVALLIFFLSRLGQLDLFSTIIGTFLPLSLIIIGVGLLNLEHVTISFMGGMHDRTPNDSAFVVVVWLSIISLVLFLPLAVCYVVMVVVNTSAARQERAKQHVLMEQNEGN